MPFADSDEVRDCIGGVFVDAFADPEVGPQLRATGLVLGLVLSEPDTVLVVEQRSRRGRPASRRPQGARVSGPASTRSPRPPRSPRPTLPTRPTTPRPR